MDEEQSSEFGKTCESEMRVDDTREVFIRIFSNGMESRDR